MVRFHVLTEPAGAHVFIGRHDMGSTPTVFELPAGPDGMANAEMVLVLDGYPTQAITSGGSGDVVVNAKLQKKVVMRSSRSRSRSPSARRSASARRARPRRGGPSRAGGGGQRWLVARRPHRRPSRPRVGSTATKPAAAPAPSRRRVTWCRSARA